MEHNKPKPSFRIERLVNFSDAIIAIAVTLMILPLIDKISDAEVTSFQSLIDTTGLQLLVFFISFAVICKFWLAHHEIFHSLKAFDARLFWLNSLWLLAIVVMPFTTELLGQQSGNENSFLIGLYIGIIAVTAWLGVALEHKIVRSPQLQNEPAKTQFSFIPAATTAVLVTIAMLISIAIPALGAWSLFILFLTSPINRLFRK